MLVENIERTLTNKLGDFARILDARLWERLDTVFSKNVKFDYADGNGEQEGIAALTQQFRSFLDSCGPSQHLLGSIQIEEGAEKGLLITRCYVQARHQGKGQKEQSFFDSNGEYIDEWRQEDAGWRIVNRRVRWLILQGDMSVLQEETAKDYDCFCHRWDRPQ